ncbi:MAG: HU family DNA-binding protein [Alphaproteobacteria bacterium]|nr:MAG: HU family DNA-binding protein [Alphaproteobacteria bacterium]
MNKRELLDRVAGKTGMKKGQIKTALEAALEVARAELEAGNDVGLAPLGRIRIRKTGEGDTARTHYRLVLTGADKPKRPGRKAKAAEEAG